MPKYPSLKYGQLMDTSRESEMGNTRFPGFFMVDCVQVLMILSPERLRYQDIRDF
jgi:hypothetical protein